MIVVSHPTALEIGQLNFALDDIGQDFGKQALGTSPSGEPAFATCKVAFVAVSSTKRR